MTAPNILFVFADQHRYDAMGCAGHPIVQTPNIDNLADRGKRFTQTWCQSPICQPSRASIITGRYAHELDVIHNVGGFDPDWDTVMKQLQAVGYETATIGKTHYHESYQPPEDDGLIDMRSYGDFVRSFGWDHVLEEFDKYLHVEERLRTPYTDYLENNNLLAEYRQQISGVFRLTDSHWRGETSALPQEMDLTSFLARGAQDWLTTRNPDKPFFLKLAFVQPHVPLIDDPQWADFYRDADIDVPDLRAPDPVNDVWESYLARLEEHSQRTVMDEAFVRNGIRHYFGMVSLVDQKLGEVLKTLEQLGQLDNTWVIYTSDHGEMLGEHHLWAKMNFYRGSVQVPLIITPPASKSRAIHTGVESGLAELTDVTATIADIASAEAPAGCHGQSLLPAFGSEHIGRELLFSRIGNYAAVRSDEHRLTAHLKSGTICELFNLETDIAEKENRASDESLSALSAQLKAELWRHENLPADL